MKKFEIINEQWIKKPDLGTNLTERLLEAIKISDVSFIKSEYDSSGDLHIWICTSSGNLHLHYKNSEVEQYKEDLALLERLLIQ